MGCYVNGVLHVYDSRKQTTLFASGVAFSLGDDIQQTYANISGNSNYKGVPEGDINIFVYSDTFQKDLTYQFLLGPTWITYYSFEKAYPNQMFYVNSNDPFNLVKFTRIDEQVAAGTFQFRGYNDGGDSVVVTQGRFDIAR